MANLRKRPDVEVCFIDVLARKAVRITGKAVIIAKAQADSDILAAFEAGWADYLQYMSAFVRIDVSAAELILSPAYDIGHTEAELQASNLAKLNAL